MSRIGYHASHEQFAPSDLLRYTKLAEATGFACAKSSDHFHPWSQSQGQSGFAWTWLGAALEATRFPIGIISAPGYRYHPAILAQAIATAGEMYPGRTWVALGSGEAINEAITGAYWPDKPERNAQLAECVEIIRALLAGETVTHRGRITVVEARLYSRPQESPALFGAAVTAETARWCAGWADGLLTTGRDAEALRPIIDAFRDGGGEEKPVHLQAALSWAPTEEQAYRNAMDQWAACCVGGEVSWDLRRPSDFDTLAKAVTPDAIDRCVNVSADIRRQTAWIESLAELGVEEIHLHQVGRNQEAFIEAVGAAISDLG
jgi:coenzyme F420-dependent glucose-6-phosphate dehydrogenase